MPFVSLVAFYNIFIYLVYEEVWRLGVANIFLVVGLCVCIYTYNICILYNVCIYMCILIAEIF